MKSNLETDLQVRIDRINALDLECVKFTLVGAEWTVARADAAEAEYKRFLTLALKYSEQPLVPAGDIDDFWHTHVLNTSKYAAD